MNTYIRTRDRRAASAEEALDEHGILKSGYGFSSPLALKDRAVGTAALSDAVVAYRAATSRDAGLASARAQFLRGMASAHDAANPRAARPTAPGTSPSQAAYERRLTEAWRQDDQYRPSWNTIHEMAYAEQTLAKQRAQSATPRPPAAQPSAPPPAKATPGTVSASQRAYENRVKDAWRAPAA